MYDGRCYRQRGFLRCVGGARVVHHVLHDRRVAPCCVFLGPAGRAQKGSRVVYFARALKLARTFLYLVRNAGTLVWIITGGRTTRKYDESLAVERKGDLLLAHDAWCSYLGGLVLLLLLCNCCC